MSAFEPPTFAARLHRPRPAVLYYYTTQDGLLGIIGKEELWATKIQYMNDTTEFNRALDLALNRLRQRQEDACNSVKTACNTLTKSLQGLDSINMFAVCFCEHGNLLSQWRGYSGNNAGYAIGFDTNALLNIVSCMDGFFFSECIYDTNLQIQIAEEAVDHCIEDMIAGKSQWDRHGPLAEILFRCGGFFKDEAFREEKEWRLDITNNRCLER